MSVYVRDYFEVSSIILTIFRRRGGGGGRGGIYLPTPPPPRNEHLKSPSTLGLTKIFHCHEEQQMKSQKLLYQDFIGIVST